MTLHVVSGRMMERTVKSAAGKIKPDLTVNDKLHEEYAGSEIQFRCSGRHGFWRQTVKSLTKTTYINDGKHLRIELQNNTQSFHCKLSLPI